MVKKELIDYAKLSGREQRSLTTTQMARKMLIIFQKHIGSRNAISRDDLFKKLFKEKYNDDDLKHYIFWDFVKKAMHLLRKKSNCFVAGKQGGYGQYEYFVVKTDADAAIYVNQMNNNIKRIRAMQRKAQQAALENWHKQTWELNYTPGKEIELK